MKNYIPIQRDYFIQDLYNWKDEKVIKVLTGMRRCGKSTVLTQLKDKFLGAGIEPNQIIFINFENLEFDELLDYQKLHAYILSKMQGDKMNYIFLDEIQNVKHFEKAIDSLFIKQNTDIYITGSNSHILSGDLATLLSGRYIEFPILPFSFNEFCKATNSDDSKVFSDFLKKGALPYIAFLDEQEKINLYIEGIYNTVIVKDIEERQSRKNNPDERKVNDILLLKTIARFLASVVGSPVNVKNVTDFLCSNGRKVSANTVSSYIDALCEAFIFYPVERYDISGKQILKNTKKYYISDLGIRNFILPKKNYDLGFSLENIVFLELKRRGYKISIGKILDKEIDFIAEKNNVPQYFQVTADMTNEETFNREIGVFSCIKDNYRKTILTLDNFTTGNYNGIEVINLIDWLKN